MLRRFFTTRIPQTSALQLPWIDNEPMKSYAPGSEERRLLTQALDEMTNEQFEVPVIINGKEYKTGKLAQQRIPCDHHKILCQYHEADAKLVNEAIQGSLAAKDAWESMPLSDRASIFLKAADLLSHRYRYKIMAATMLGQGKTIWQAEIDTAAELADFWRFNAKYALQLAEMQPEHHSPTFWNRVEYRPLEGFVGAISPFNFTAIGGNLCSAPAMMGNVVVWKPSNSAILSNYIVYQILREAGLPASVIQFVPGPPDVVVNQMMEHREFAGLHFTGSTAVFKDLWLKSSQRLDKYRSFPRIVGETGGKNMHFVHVSADIQNAVNHTIRSAFEYQGQKCSACSRLYVPDSLWPQFKAALLKEHAKITVGHVREFNHLMSAVIHQGSFDKIKSYIDYAKNSTDAKILAGGQCDNSKGYFVQPTIIETSNPDFKTMHEEIFGPVLTVYVYPENAYIETLKLAAETSPYALTAGIFAQDREALIAATYHLRNAAGAVVGQQPFGGSRASGTNDKAGSLLNLIRWTSPRTIKESFVPISDWSYPSMKL